jgi:hypothetical protein
VLYLHGSSVGPHGRKTEWLEGHGHPVVGQPTLPYPRHRRRSWRWLAAFLDRRWFSQAVEVAQESYDRCGPDVIVGSSMGGAVAMNLDSGATPQVLIAPAWRVWTLFRFGPACRVKPATAILHGDRDRLVLLSDSRRLLTQSPPPTAAAGLVATLEEGLAARLGRGPGLGCRGRPIVIEGEEHRCEGEAALRALTAAVEVLAGRNGEHASRYE